MCLNGNLEMLQMFQGIAPVLNSVVEEDIGIFVYDREKLLVYTPSAKINLGIMPGAPVKEGSIPDRCMRDGKKVVTLVSKEKSRVGIPYLSCATPILENDRIIGCIITNQNLDTYNDISDIAGVLDESSHDLSASMEEVSAQVQTLSDTARNLDQMGKNLHQDTEKIDHVIGFIRNVAQQTNLLGLNAAIEAARVGEAGRGFAVVADEVRKLSSDSTQSAKDITETLKSIQEGMAQLSRQANAILVALEEQSAVVQEVTATSTTLASTANQLNGLSQNLYNLTE